MIVLGIIDSKPSAAAVIKDGKILSAIAEERLCRMKLASGLPRAAISESIKIAGVSVADIDRVAVAQNVSVYEPEPIPWKGWFDDVDQLKTYKFDLWSAGLAPIFGRLPLAWTIHHQIKRFRSRERLKKIPQVMADAYGIKAPVLFYDHHYCHAVSAYFASTFNEALVITLDGGGDGRSGSAYLASNGHLSELTGVDSFNSLGNFYSYVTELCGFKAEKHEGKITGLAALGKPRYLDILRQFIQYREPGNIRYTIPMYYHSAIRLIKNKLPRDFDRADLAASVQFLLEDIGVKFIRYWLIKTGQKNIAAAGGVFANVKFNQRVHEIPEVDNIFIYPAMDDSGLAVGAGLAALAEHYNDEPVKLNQRLPNLYLGPEYTKDGLENLVKSSGCEVIYHENIQGKIAELLSAGKVVARFTGRMEYGPRALGHRTIYYQTTDTSVNDWLNEKLHRTEFMPFAPVTLIDKAHEYYENLNGAEYPARFMTITFNCTSKMKSQSPGVVHVDGTARPQLVDPESAPDVHKILSAYYQLTGIPSLINTSFNMHEEPIVCTPQDAIRSFKEGHLDYLAIDNWLLSNSK